MSRLDRSIFRRMVPRAARRAARVLVVSERTKADIVELYGVAPEKIVVTPHGVDAVFAPGDDAPGSYLLLVGAIQARKNPLAAVDAANEAGLRLVVVGPIRDRGLADELARRGADVRGYVAKDELAELYRGAACLLMPSRYEGFGLPVLEAMASGTPVVAVAGSGAARGRGRRGGLRRPRASWRPAIREAIAPAGRASGRGPRARPAGSRWAETARRTVAVYREVLGL